MDRYAFWDYLGRWIFRVVDGFAPETRPVMVGLSAVQGSGKTTLTREVGRMAGERGLRAVSLSIDDFYLTRREQADLARTHPDNPYLQHRGYPGTHDVALGTRTLVALKRIGASSHVAIPAYDKTAWEGSGDRRPEGEWTVVDGPLDLVILEGWMLGFAPVGDADLPDRFMIPINRALAAYQAWWDLLDAVIWIEAEDPRYAVDWRAEAEARSRAAGNPGMTDAAVRAFTSAYIPGYFTYQRTLAARHTGGRFLHLVIGRDRLPKSLPA